MSTKEQVLSNISFYRGKISQFIDNAIDFAKCGLADSARTYFEVALSYKAQLVELENELERIKNEEEKEYRRLLKEQIKKDLEDEF